jgi:two-component system NarL family sensor kinase
LRNVLTELHRITAGLRPSSLDDLGLLPTITWYCRDFVQLRPRLKIRCDLRTAEDEVPAELKLQIFRIVEEAIRNVGEHAAATEAAVSLVSADGQLVLRIEDNGTGFDADRVLRGDVRLLGIGLQSIAKRVDGTGGRMEVRSVAGDGTTIIARWPLASRA